MEKPIRRGDPAFLLQRHGQVVGDCDLLIAAIALAYGETRIVTRNVRDFRRIRGIEVVGY